MNPVMNEFAVSNLSVYFALKTDGKIRREIRLRRRENRLKFTLDAKIETKFLHLYPRRRLELESQQLFLGKNGANEVKVMRSRLWEGRREKRTHQLNG